MNLENITYRVKKTIDNIVQFLPNILSKISRIIAYIPILWKIREWDNSYLLQLWAFTLDRHIKKTYDEGIAVVTKSQRRRAKACSAALRRMANEEYDAWYLHMLYTDVDGEDFFARLNRERTPEEARMSKEMRSMEEYLYQQDADLVGKFLKKEIRKLWD